MNLANCTYVNIFLAKLFIKFGLISVLQTDPAFDIFVATCTIISTTSVIPPPNRLAKLPDNMDPKDTLLIRLAKLNIEFVTPSDQVFDGNLLNVPLDRISSTFLIVYATARMDKD